MPIDPNSSSYRPVCRVQREALYWINRLPESEYKKQLSGLIHEAHGMVKAMARRLAELQPNFNYKMWARDYTDTSMKEYVPHGCNAVSFESAIYHPAHACLFDSTGKRILSSCVERGIDTLGYDPPDQIEVPQNYLDELVFYGGAIQGPFGHILTEGLSRIWHVMGTRGRVIVHAKNGIPQWLRRLFEIAGIDSSRFFQLDKPTVIKHVILPDSTFRNGRDCKQEHTAFFEAVGRKLAPKKTLSETLYLSRRELPPNLRKVVNEKDIEHGHVVFPEQIPVEDQIRLINQYDHVAGCVGSAMHLLLFRVNSIKSVSIYCASERGKYANYRMIDDIKTLPTKYIEALTADPECKKENRLKRNYVADMNKFSKQDGYHV